MVSSFFIKTESLYWILQPSLVTILSNICLIGSMQPQRSSITRFSSTLTMSICSSSPLRSISIFGSHFWSATKSAGRNPQSLQPSLPMPQMIMRTVRSRAFGKCFYHAEPYFLDRAVESVCPGSCWCKRCRHCCVSILSVLLGPV
jgi:hypothetical protein